MSTEPRHRYTLEEYFALESNSEEKYEFWKGEVFCMSGASLAHNQIAQVGWKTLTPARAELRI